MARNINGQQFIICNIHQQIDSSMTNFTPLVYHVAAEAKNLKIARRNLNTGTSICPVSILMVI